MRKYDHLERFGHQETHGIDVGRCFVFPKLDGTNARVQVEDDCTLVIGSRRREISLEDDNHGFAAWCEENHDALQQATYNLGSNKVVIHGEWMVPHTLKTYREEVWRRFWVFDVWDMQRGRYVPYDGYAEPLQQAGLDVVEPLAIVDNPTRSQLDALVASNTYMIQDGKGSGEGIVIKNYGWENRFGRQPWAKLVRTEFKESHRREMGTPVLGTAFQAEAAIAEHACTETLVYKELAKIRAELGDDQRHILIPRLLGTVYYCVVKEELWEALKKYKFPTVDFRRLRKFVEQKTKEHASELF